jgi:hypothetical protein
MVCWCYPPYFLKTVWCNNKITQVWFLREQVEGVSRPKTITSVFLLPQKSHECHKNYQKQLFIPEFTRQVRHDVAMTLRRRSYDITSTCPTIRMTSLRIPDDTDATEEIRITRMLYLIFLCHPTARSPDSTGVILLVCLRNISSWWCINCRINFARRGILVCVF